MSKRTLFLIFALFLITFVLLILAFYQPSNTKTVQKTTATVEQSAGQTVLSFENPSASTPSSVFALNYSLPVTISTGENKVTAVQLELQYDPNILINIEVVPGPFFANPQILLNQIDIKAGRISYALGIGQNEKATTGSGTVANITFSVESKIPEKTAIIFLPKTLVTAEGINGSALKRTNVGQFLVGISNSTPSAAVNR
jgi:hypothetical protein